MLELMKLVTKPENRFSPDQVVNSINEFKCDPEGESASQHITADLDKFLRLDWQNENMSNFLKKLATTEHEKDN